MLEKRRYFNPEITLGHLFQAAIMAVTVIALYYGLDKRIAYLETRDSERHEEVRAINLNQTAILHQLTVLQTIWDERFNRK